MKFIIVLFAPIICLLIKVFLYLINIQPFNFRGYPSGHAATLSALVTYLYITKESINLLFTTIIITSTYLFDICLIYYSDIRDKYNQRLGHSLSEIISGCIVGILTIIIFQRLI